MGWTESDTAAQRKYTEDLFRLRTKKKVSGLCHFMDHDPGTRVTRLEVTAWCERELGKRPPICPEYMKAHAIWFRSMAEGVHREFGLEAPMWTSCDPGGAADRRKAAAHDRRKAKRIRDRNFQLGLDMLKRGGGKV